MSNTDNLRPPAPAEETHIHCWHERVDAASYCCSCEDLPHTSAEPPLNVVLVDREVAATKAEGAWANMTHLGRAGESGMYEYACHVAANLIRSLPPYIAPAEPEGEQEQSDAEPDIYDAVAAFRAKDGNCVICGHNDLDADGVTCAAPVPICSDESHGIRHCGCRCMFLARPKGEQSYHEGFDDAARVSRVLNQIAVTTPTTPPTAAMRAAAKEIAAFLNNPSYRAIEEVEAIITRHLPAPTVTGLPVCPKCQQAYVCDHCGEPIGDYYADAATTSSETPERSLEIFDAGFAPIAGTDDNEERIEVPESLLRDQTRAEQRKAAGDCANCGTPIVEAFATGIGYYWYHVRGLAYCDTDNPSFKRTATPAALNQVEGEGK